MDIKVRNLKCEYEYSRRELMREFDHKLINRGSMLDRFSIKMIEADSNMYSSLYETVKLLRDKTLLFQYFREYPNGFPSQYRSQSPTLNSND